MNMNGIVIQPSGLTSVLPCNTLADLQFAVGGYVESPSILRDEISHLTMWCNEEAIMLGLEINPLATWVVGWPEHACILGDVFITGAVGRNGETTSLKIEDANTITRLVREGMAEGKAEQ